MTEIDRVVDLLQRSFDGHPWYGPPLMEALADVTAKQAVERTVHNAHSIWELVLHMISWQSAAVNALSGEAMPTMPWREDWPPVRDASEEAWQQAVEDLRASNLRLIEAAKMFPAGQLDQLVPGRRYAYYVLLHGMAEHNAYHGGQIALLKKKGAPRQ